MPVVLCIERCNHHMGAHQLRSYYDTQLTSFRTLRPMYFGSQDMITNTYIIFIYMAQCPDAITPKGFVYSVLGDLF